MLSKQMEMFEEGGLRDEGGTVDPVSGNDVPSGSNKSEVRDDIPAMLSEGEFVIPADVVRYIGLSKLMQMRQEAKMGLQMMEKMGQMGNSEEAEIPDDLPFGVTDIVVMGNDDDDDDEKEMAQGGVIYAQEGTDVPSNEENSGFMPHLYFYNTETKQYRLLPAGMLGRTSGDTEITQEEYKKAIGDELANERIQEANKVYKNMPQPKPEKDYTQSKEPVAPQPTSEKNYYTDEYGMPMMKLPPQQPQQTDFERMMGYEAGRGDNPNAPSRVAYKNKKGEVVYVLEDYMGRPMESTAGLTRVTPYGPKGDQPTPAPSPDPTPDDGESVRDTSKRDARRAAKADARELAVADAMQTSAERVFPNLTPEEAISKYGELTLSQRIKLIPQEIKVMTGSDVSSEVVEDVINNPDTSTDNPAVSFIKTVIGGILKTVGIDIDKTSDNIAGAIKDNGNATKPLSKPMVNGKNVAITNNVPDELSDGPQFNNLSSTSTFDANKPDELIDSPQFNSASTTKPNLNARPDYLDIVTPKPTTKRILDPRPDALNNRYDDVSAADSMPDAFEPYKPTPQGEGRVDMRGQLGQNKTDPFDMATKNTVTDTRANDAALAMQTNNMLGAAQATTSPFGSDPTFASSVIPPKVEPVFTPSFVQGMTDADKVAGTTPERKGQIFDSVPTMFDLSGYKERQAKRQADFDAQVDQINEGLKILEGTTLSSKDKKKTSTRKLKIDAKQGTGAFADKQRKEKDRDKRRKRQDAKKAADKRVKDYKEGKQTFRGRGGRAKGGLMKKDYP